MKETLKPAITPDGRYIVVKGRLWRATNPNLPARKRNQLVKALMAARRLIAIAKPGSKQMKRGRGVVDQAKRALGERARYGGETRLPI